MVGVGDFIQQLLCSQYTGRESSDPATLGEEPGYAAMGRMDRRHPSKQNNEILAI